MSGSAEVIVYGDVNIDVLVLTDVVPRGDVSLLANDIKVACGGVGANISSALSKLGVKTSLIGAVGNDVFGCLALKELKKKGVEVDHVKVLRSSITGLMIVFINSQGIRSIIGYRGANAEANAEECLKVLHKARHLHISGYTFLNKDEGRSSLKLLCKANEEGITTSVDLEGIAFHKPSSMLKLAGLVDYVMLNREELLYITKGEKLNDKAMTYVLEEIKPKALLVKLGKEGSIIIMEKEKIKVQPFKVRVVDTTGAGDGFNAGFIYGILRGLTIKESATLGNALGAYVCTGLGAQHHPSIKQLLHKFPQIKGILR